MKTKIIIGLSALAMLLQGMAFAVTAAEPASQTSEQTEAAPVAKATEGMSFCPDISQIQKNQITVKWEAQTKDGTWKSYQTSFATNLTQFVGAQWAGEAVGQVTCIYKAEQRFTMQGNLTIQPALPVLLVFHTLTFQPTIGKWKHVSEGVYNCYAFDKEDCPFKMNVQKQTENVLQEAESLKTSSTNAIQPESY